MKFKGMEMKLQVVTGESTYKDTLHARGIKTEQVAEGKKVAAGIGTRVICDCYKYISPNTNEPMWIYEFVEITDGNGEIGCYVVGSTIQTEVNISELYDAVMKEIEDDQDEIN